MALDLPIPEFLSRIPSDPQHLFDLVRPRIDDGMLQTIASADYGFKASELFPVLKEIRDSGEIPAELDAFILDVLSLTRWATVIEGDTRGHLTRAFACIIMLRAAKMQTFSGENNTLVQLILSAWALGAKHLEATLRIILWRFEINAWHEACDRAFFAFAAFVLVVALRGESFSDEEISGAAIWTCEEEARVRHSFRDLVGSVEDDPPPGWTSQWLLGLPGFHVETEAWQALGRWLINEAGGVRSTTTQEWLRLLGACLNQVGVECS